VALVTDGRFSGATRGMMVGYVSPEAATGGPLALVRGGDRIRIDAVRGRLDLLVPRGELDRRRRAWMPPRRAPLEGVLEKYAALVGPAFRGAVTHSGPAGRRASPRRPAPAGRSGARRSPIRARRRRAGG
jgi:dihydroxy-acid dehydratase